MDLVSTNLIYSSISHLFYCNLLRIPNNYNYHRIEYYFRKRVKSSRKITISDFSLQQLSYDSWIVDFFRSERWNVSRMVTVFRDVGKVGGKGAAAADNYPRSYPHPSIVSVYKTAFFDIADGADSVLGRFLSFTAHSSIPRSLLFMKIF